MDQEQTWALGTIEGRPREIEVFSKSGEHRILPLEEAVALRTPYVKTQRHSFQGDFTSWGVGTADAYLAGLGLVLPVGVKNRHEVYTIPVSEKLIAYVPALVLMRAFFKPHYCVFSAVFRPVSLELLSFVDYNQTPPVVVMDGLEALYKSGFRTQNSVSRERAIQWCQLSVSARQMSWSVFRHATLGRLGLTLPQGSVQIVLHGVRERQELFVTKAALSTVVVSPEDSLTGGQERYVFHAGADESRERYASVKGLSIPARADGEYRVSDAEWELLEPEFLRTVGCSRYPHRDVLDWILLKITSGAPWLSLTDDPKLLSAVKNSFRNWSADGRMGIALEVLTATREFPQGLPALSSPL